MEVARPLAPPRASATVVADASQVAEARRTASALARAVGLDEEREGTVALIVTEAATNIVKHAKGGGHIIVIPIEDPAVRGVEILALDKGAGMANVQECLDDGYSTTGTQGSGLGAIRRQADEFDVCTAAGQGTAVLARVFAEPPRRPAEGLLTRIAGLCLPIAGEPVSGDAWTWSAHPAAPRILVTDGLGHGPLAAEASAVAVGAFRANVALPLAVLLEAIHDALRVTRGAVVAVAELDSLRDEVRYVAVGNISAAVVAAGRQHNMVSMNGTMGFAIGRVREFAYGWTADAVLVLHSDGLGTKWSLDDYRGLAARDPALIAGVLWRDHARGRDDVTVVVAKKAGR
jgi:anti-sigma regulatory factor (Ser/Thr protein kinase)